MIKQTLAHMKVHISARELSRAIIMPRDQDSYHPELPTVHDALLTNPYKETGNEKKKKRRNDGPARGGLMRAADNTKGQRDILEGGPLEQNDKLEYKVFEFGNFPMRLNKKDDWVPKAGCYRLMLPAEADWTRKETEEER